MPNNEYECVNQETENEYGSWVLQQLIFKKLRILPMERIKSIAGEIFKLTPEIKYGSDGELVFVYPKDDDPIRDELAYIALRELGRGKFK